MEEFFRRIEQLVCYPAPAGLWESEIFPPRLQSYGCSWLDNIMQQSELRWIGSGNRRVCFYFEPDLDLMKESGIAKEGSSGLTRLFPDGAARYDFSTLLRVSKLRPAELAERLWKAVWRGQVMNDTFLSLRRGLETRFKVTGLSAPALRTPARRRRTGGRTAFSRWKGSLPFAGNWQRVPEPPQIDDLIEKEEQKKDRARVLLDRYGIVFRELLQNELPLFRWSGVFRALRLMELSGEVFTGYFFHGVPGPQFISHEAFRMLQRKMPEDAVYWIAATDPASLCGVPLDGLKGSLPRRVAGTHLVYRGNKVVLVSQRNAGALTFHESPDSPHLQAYLGFLRHLLTREFQPVRRIVIETINNLEAARSPYLDALRTGFEVNVDYRNVILYRAYPFQR
jgi:ATP-dependent Lhr-like helicase